MKIKNKWLLAIGTSVVAVSPVIAVVSCGTSSSIRTNENAISQAERDAYKAELKAWTDDFADYSWSKNAITSKYVDEQAFFNADLTKVVGKVTGKGFYLPRFIESIGDGAFWNAKLPATFKLVDTATAITGYDLWRGVKSIGASAFKGVDFSQFTGSQADFIPDSVWSIDNEGFNSTILPEGFKVKPSIIEMGADIFAGSTIPKDFTFEPDEDTLADGTFSSAKLKGDLTLPEKIHVIGERSFQNVDFTNKKLNYSKNVYKIKNEAFEGATFSEKFVVADAVQEIQAQAFSQTILKKGIQIGESNSRLTVISENAFNHVQATDTFDLTNAHNLVKIDSKAFVSAVLPSDFIIPKSVRSIGQLAFSEADFTAISNPETFLFGDGTNYGIDPSQLSPTSFTSAKLPRGFRLWGAHSNLNSSILGEAFTNIVVEPGVDWDNKDTLGPQPGAKLV